MAPRSITPRRRPARTSSPARPTATSRARPHAAARGPASRPGDACVFRATLEDHGPTGQWPHLFLPQAASVFLGRRGAVPVVVSVHGMGFRRTAKPDGEGGHYVRFNADLRERAGVETGDVVEITLTLDTAPRDIELPREFGQMLHADADARAAFAAMPASHRRAYLEFIEKARRPETRARRMQQALRMMSEWAAERARRPERRPRAATRPRN